MHANPILKHMQGFTVIGFSVTTQNQDEFNETTAKLPKLWQQFYSSELATNTTPYGVYSNYESDANGFYIVTAGIAAENKLSLLSAVEIQTGHYLVFEGKGAMPSTVVELWKQVWKYFEEKSEYQRNFTSDFEMYIGNDGIAIYIGIK